MIDDQGLDGLLASATNGFLSGMEDCPAKKIRCSPKAAAEADIVDICSTAGFGILSRATSDNYEAEMAIENGDFITVVYKRKAEDGRDSDGFSVEKSRDRATVEDETCGSSGGGGDLMSVSQRGDSREVMPPPPPLLPAAAVRADTRRKEITFSLPSPLLTSTPMTSPAKKRKLAVDEVPESSSRLLDLVNVPQTSRNNDVNTTLDYLQYTGFDHWKSVSFTSNVR